MGRTQRAMAWTAVIALTGLAAVAAVYASTRLPTDGNLAEVIRKELALSVVDREQSRCVSPPVDHPAPDARSKLQNFGWHADFLKTPGKPGREKQLAQLDAMVAVGLLDKVEASIEDPVSGPQPAWRYRLSTNGWVATARGNCMRYGPPSLLRIVEKKETDLKGEKVQIVRAKLGVRPEDLAKWARDPGMLAAFPEMAQAIQDREEQFRLHWHGGKWQRYRESGWATPSSESLPGEEALPHATREELVREISKFPHQSCLKLPGDEKLPVDKILYAKGTQGQRFAIYLDKPRQPWDRVVGKTVPVVIKMMQAGAIVRLPDQQLTGDGADRGQTFQGAVYELSPALRALQEPNSTCVSLGALTHEIIDLQYRHTDGFGRSIPSFSFKKIVKLKSPPPALTDPVLLAAWPDLRGALESGIACAGGFQFNRKTRESEAGMASCWFAFDSYYENY